MTPASGRQTELLAALRWQIDVGADEAVLDAPVDRFAAVRETAARARPPAPRGAAAVSRDATATESPAAAAPAPERGADESARELAGACADLAALKTALEAFDGCALKTTATNTVFGTGAVPADAMLVGEAPGRDEDREGLPFVGASGRLLDAMLGFLDLDRNANVYIANILPWRPPGNRQPTGTEIAACLPFLERHIALVAPRILVFLGGTSAKTLLNSTEGITRLRGQWYEYASPSLEAAGLDPIPAMATLHPAYLLRQPAQKRAAWLDLIAVRKRLDEGLSK